MHSEDWTYALEQALRRCQDAGVDRAQAEDCVQDAILALLAQRTTLEEIRSVPAWLSVAARRRAIDHLRRTSREHVALARLTARTPPDPEPAEEVTERALAHWLADALNSLPATTQRVCRAVGEGQSVQQVAAKLGLSHRAVESHLTRARRYLRGLAAGAVAVLAGSGGRFPHPAASVPLVAPVAAAAVAITVAVAVVQVPHFGSPTRGGYSVAGREPGGAPAETVHSASVAPTNSAVPQGPVAGTPSGVTQAPVADPLSVHPLGRLLPTDVTPEMPGLPSAAIAIPHDTQELLRVVPPASVYQVEELAGTRIPAAARLNDTTSGT